MALPREIYQLGVQLISRYKNPFQGIVPNSLSSYSVLIKIIMRERESQSEKTSALNNPIKA